MCVSKINIIERGYYFISRKSPKSPKNDERVKQPRVWALGGDSRDLPTLDFSTDKPEDADDRINADTQVSIICKLIPQLIVQFYG